MRMAGLAKVQRQIAIPLRNITGSIYLSITQKRNTTAWETDNIDSTTGKGLSANGNPSFEE